MFSFPFKVIHLETRTLFCQNSLLCLSGLCFFISGTPDIKRAKFYSQLCNSEIAVIKITLSGLNLSISEMP